MKVATILAAATLAVALPAIRDTASPVHDLTNLRYENELPVPTTPQTKRETLGSEVPVHDLTNLRYVNQEPVTVDDKSAEKRAASAIPFKDNRKLHYVDQTPVGTVA